MYVSFIERKVTAIDKYALKYSWNTRKIKHDYDKYMDVFCVSVTTGLCIGFKPGFDPTQ